MKQQRTSREVAGEKKKKEVKKKRNNNRKTGEKEKGSRHQVKN